MDVGTNPAFSAKLKWSGRSYCHEDSSGLRGKELAHCPPCPCDMRLAYKAKQRMKKIDKPVVVFKKHNGLIAVC